LGECRRERRILRKIRTTSQQSLWPFSQHARRFCREENRLDSDQRQAATKNVSLARLANLEREEILGHLRERPAKRGWNLLLDQNRQVIHGQQRKNILQHENGFLDRRTG
jgi:hypothetical protein